VLDYPLNDFLFEGMRRAYLSMAEIQFAAGAIEVLPIHETAEHYASWDKAQAALQALPMQPLTTFVGSAHLMGGCTMAADETQGVVRPDGVHWQIDNLSVHDGSLFPTSIGANPQLSIYGLTNKLTSDLIRRLGGQPVTLA
jgi:choline dehydrogenase-like flavoprotein